MWQATGSFKKIADILDADQEKLQIVSSDADKKAAEKQAREDTTLQASDNTTQ
jgi:hypothetical protein